LRHCRTDVVRYSVEVWVFCAEELQRPETCWFTLIHPHDRERIAAEAGRLAEKPSRLVREYRIVAKDGRTIWVEDRVSSRFSADGEFCGVEGIVLDVTERTKLQAQIAQSDRLASVGVLAAGVAHEVNNPLTYVLYHLESIAEDLPSLATDLHRMQDATGTETNGEAMEPLPGLVPILTAVDDLSSRAREAVDGAHRIRAIVRDLKTFSRAEQESIGPVYLNQVAQRAIDMASNQIKFKARLIKNFGSIPTIIANEGRLAQVLLNLLVNAAHAIEEGARHRNEIRVRTWCEDGNVVAEVSDTGKGIPAKHIPHIFEPFYSTKESGQGTGMGLSICRAILARFGGEIEVQSVVDTGTRFWIRLPIDIPGLAPTKAGGANERAREARSDVRGRILVIDDEPGILNALERSLSEHAVLTARDGCRAREILERDRGVDLILCDLMMPEVTGMDLHDWLAARDPGLAERMVFMTGGVFTPRAGAFLQEVDNPRLEKPFDRNELKQLVQDLLSTWGRVASLSDSDT